jgi:hypothetical protein
MVVRMPFGRERFPRKWFPKATGFATREPNKNSKAMREELDEF